MNKFALIQSHGAATETAMYGNAVRIIFKGALVYEFLDAVDAKLQRISRHSKSYIFDMKEVTRIDSTGLAFIINLAKRLMQSDTKFVIVVDNDIISKLFRISQLDYVFPLIRTIDLAKKALEENPFTKIAFDNYLNMSISNIRN